MIKLLLLAILASLACRMLAGRWPWDLLRVANGSAGAAQARALLGVSRTATRDEIVEAHRRVIADVHPDRGGSNERVHEANAARDLLLARLPGTDRS